MLTVALLPSALNDAPAADGANTIRVHKAVPIGGSSGDHHHHCVFSRDQGDYSAGPGCPKRRLEICTQI